MESEKKPQPKPEEKPYEVACRFLLDSLRDAGMHEHVFLAVEPYSTKGAAAQIFASSNSSTEAMAHMFLFLFNRMDDEAVGNMLNWLLNQPVVMAKMAAFQAKQMARHAEEMKAKAAASPIEPPESKPQPSVEDKNKSWLN